MKCYSLKDFSLFALFVPIFFVGCVSSFSKTHPPLVSDKLWQTTQILDEQNHDVTQQNMQFVGLAKYNADNSYEFFNLDHSPRGDQGYFFVLPDKSKRIIISTSKHYSRIVDITELNSQHFTYSTINNSGKRIFIHHSTV